MTDADRVDLSRACHWRASHRGLWTCVVATSKEDAQILAWSRFVAHRRDLHPDRTEPDRWRQVVARQASPDDIERWLEMRAQQEAATR